MTPSGMAGASAGAGGTVAPPPPTGGTTGGAGGGAGSAGGSAGTAGAAGSSGAGGAAGSTAGAGGGTSPATSAGCDAADWPESGTFMIDVDGLMREYIVKIPDGYDSSKPYKLVFAWHYLGGSAAGIAGGFGGGYYGLESQAAGSAIFVAPEGIDAAWPNSGGRDVAFAQAMVDWMRSSYCIDNTRIFSVGFSYGAIMSNTVGCAMGDVFRAIAPMSGSGPRSFGGGSCKGPVAAWLAHGTNDSTVSFASGEGSRDHWVMANGCDTQTMPTSPSPCVAYQGCDDGYPVTWCEFSGGHTQFSGAGSAIWAFFSQF
jgi:poly(3-hydroxybutyrate) depolymerase